LGYWISCSQKPPVHMSEQHCAPLVHAEPTAPHAEPRSAHEPFVHTLLQHCASVVHAPDAATHATWHVCVVVSHAPWQQSSSTVHAPFCAAHVALPASQRWVWLSQTSEQQPLCGPELRFSPMPRQVVFAASSWQTTPLPVSMQMFEQQSAFAAHAWLSCPHSAPPQTPAWQSRLQQSVAFAQVWPSATHSAMHCVTPVWPSTGSQRPLQHGFVGPSTQDSPAPVHVPAGKHSPPLHRFEQQSPSAAHASVNWWQPGNPSAVAPALPPPSPEVPLL
jgi:hypothetical protein